MDEFTEWLQQKAYSPASIKQYTYSVQRFLEWLGTKNVLPQHVTYARLTAYLQYLKEQGHGTRYRTARLNGMRHYFAHLMETGQVADNPAEGLHIRGTVRHLPHQHHTKEKLKGFFTNCPDRESPVGQFIGLMAFQGLRPREIARLTKQDFDLEGATVFIKGDKRTASRTLPLETVQLVALQAYLPKVNGPLIPQERFHAERLKAESYLKRSGVAKLQHVRASVICGWVERYNLREAQYRAGHKYVSSTERYLRSQPETLQKAVAQFHPLG